MQQSSETTTGAEQPQRRFRASEKAMRTFNPIRAIVDNIQKPAANPDKPMINLSLGALRGL